MIHPDKGFVVGNALDFNYYGKASDHHFLDQEKQLKAVLESGTGVKLIARDEVAEPDTKALYIQADGLRGNVKVGESPALASFLDQYPHIARVVKVQVTGGRETRKPLNTRFTDEYTAMAPKESLER